MPDPVDLHRLRDNLNSDDPTTAALTALLAFHAVRPWQLRAMLLTDLHDGRLHIGEQVIVLAEPAMQRLAGYLDYRARTWPTTINPHLFIHRRSWMHDRPVTPWWLHHQLGMSGQLIRQDRILDEAHATSGDLRMLCELFDLSATGAMRYTATVNSPDRGGTYRGNSDTSEVKTEHMIMRSVRHCNRPPSVITCAVTSHSASARESPPPSLVAAWMVLGMLDIDRVPWWAGQWPVDGHDGPASPITTSPTAVSIWSAQRTRNRALKLRLPTSRHADKIRP